ncbi:MAG: hypothetical protein ACOCVA_08285 [Prolixibacteraceae bacterium]
MKKLQQLLNCACKLIKKKFFNSSGNDFYKECTSMPLPNYWIEREAEEDTEEYITNYKLTTRWQTL